MNMRTIFVIGSSIISILAFFSIGVILRRVFKISRIACVLGSIHLAAVILNAYLIEVSMLKPGPSEALLGWLLFDLIDIPSSFFQMLIGLTIKSFMIREICLPIIFFGIIGSMQYVLFCELIKRFLGGCKTKDK